MTTQKTYTTNGLIADFYQEFPAMKDHVFFLTNEAGIGTPQAVSAKVNALHPNANITADTLQDFNHGKPAVTPFAQAAGKPTLHFVAGFDAVGMVDKTVMFENALIAERNKESFAKYNLVFLIDHELGHLVTAQHTNKAVRDKSFTARDGHDNDIGNAHDEAMADAYALIRHVQRFGNDTGYLEYIRDQRAMDLVIKGDAGHYTSHTIDAVIAAKNDGKFDHLSPQQCAKMASDIADQHVLGGRIGAKMENTFSRFSKLPTDTPDSLLASIRIVAKEALRSKSADALQATSLFLRSVRSALPENDAAMKAAVRKEHARVVLQQRDPEKPSTFIGRLSEKVFGHGATREQTREETSPPRQTHNAPKIK